MNKNKNISLSDRNKIKQFYNNRCEEHGDSIASVGWGSREDQYLRFDVLFRRTCLNGKTVLDIGCGLGDLVDYLDSATNGDFQYIGLDISEKLIQLAREKYNRKNCRFEVGEIVDFALDQTVNISVESGALSYKIENNLQYTQAVMARMFEISTEMSALNFLSSYVDYELEKNCHYSPEDIFGYAKKLTPYVALYHDYPLWEFTVQLMKRK